MLKTTINYSPSIFRWAKIPEEVHSEYNLVFNYLVIGLTNQLALLTIVDCSLSATPTGTYKIYQTLPPTLSS